VTWEKDYKRGPWNEKEVQGAFVMERCRKAALINKGINLSLLLGSDVIVPVAMKVASLQTY
jgi:hypothetical protein